MIVILLSLWAYCGQVRRGYDIREVVTASYHSKEPIASESDAREWVARLTRLNLSYTSNHDLIMTLRRLKPGSVRLSREQLHRPA